MPNLADRDLQRPPEEPAADRYALFMIGIDTVAAVEELYGEALAETVIAEVQERLARAVPPVATLWRAEHRSFGLSVPGMGRTGAGIMAAELQGALALEPVATESGPVGLSLSIGAAVGGADEKGLLGEAARHALSEARAAGCGSFRIAPNPTAVAQAREDLRAGAEAAMSAIDAERLTIAFQPVVRAVGGPVIAFHECLVRIRDKDGALVPARRFMPAVERLGLAPLIDRQVLGLAMAELRQQRSARLSINIFPQTMQDLPWLLRFEELVGAHPDCAERLIIEVTETAAMLEPERTRAFMDRLRSTGVAFALDDFGVGHTSFRQLREFRFDMLKIDGSFIADIARNADNRFFVRMLAQIAERFDMMTIAEFVQGPAEARILADLGIGFFQGYHYGKPGLVLAPVPDGETAAQA